MIEKVLTQDKLHASLTHCCYFVLLLYSAVDMLFLTPTMWFPALNEKTHDATTNTTYCATRETHYPPQPHYATMFFNTNTANPRTRTDHLKNDKRLHHKNCNSNQLSTNECAKPCESTLDHHAQNAHRILAGSHRQRHASHAQCKL